MPSGWPAFAFASDVIFSDFALERGWAYIAHDKGSIGSNFFQDSCDLRGTCGSAPTSPGACGDTSQAWCAGVVGIELAPAGAPPPTSWPTSAASAAETPCRVVPRPV